MTKRWRRALARANRLRDASRLPDLTDRDIAIIRAGLKGWYWDTPYFTDETLYAAASLALDGMPVKSSGIDLPRCVPVREVTMDAKESGVAAHEKRKGRR